MFLFNSTLQRKDAPEQLTIISKLHSIAPEVFFNLDEANKQTYKYMLERIRILYQDKYNYCIFDNYGIDIVSGISFKKYEFICTAQNTDLGFPIKLNTKHVFSDKVQSFLRETEYDRIYWDLMTEKDEEANILPRIFMDLDSPDLFYRVVVNLDKFSLVTSLLDKYDFILHACTEITVLGSCTIIKLMSRTFPDLYMISFGSVDYPFSSAEQSQHFISPKNFWLVSRGEKEKHIKFIENTLRRNTRTNPGVVHIFRIPDEKIWLEHSLQLARFIKDG